MDLKEFLDKNNITILELSKKIKIPYTTLYNGIEKNNSLKAENLKKIADFFHISMDETFQMLENKESTLGDFLYEQMKNKLKGSIYHYTQIKFTFNSNRIEGSKLSEEETRYIFETDTLFPENKMTKVNDVVETANHFYLFDKMLEEYQKPLSEEMIKEFHRILKNGTRDSRESWFQVGEYKKKENIVGGKETTHPKKVEREMKKLLRWYNEKDKVSLENIIEFHYIFESIHPFQDGNGRVGRMIMFRECLKNNIVPFIVEDEYKGLYYRGLSEYTNEKGYLNDTILFMQDKYREIVKKFLDI